MTGGRCAVREGRLEVDGRPFFVYSGEIHYFRVDPAEWPDRLRKAKRAGLNTVSSYIPWRWHERTEKKFDFTGRTHPARNLVRWMDEIVKAGLFFIARIGPVSNAELIREGLPDWLMEKYHEVHLAGRPLPGLPHVTIVAYRSPVFIEKVSNWYRALLPRLLPYHHTMGGPIILTQICNEIGMVHWLNRAADYSPRAENAWREFLKNKYGDISELNRAWGGTGSRKRRLGSWNAVRQPAGALEQTRWAEAADWALFYRDYYAGYFAALSGQAAKEGFTGPYIANIPQFWDHDVRGRGTPAPMTSSLFRDFQKKTPAPVLFGGAYQMRRLDIDNFHDIALATESVNLLHPDGDVPSICAELQTGIMRDRPRLYGTDVELNLKTSTAHGLGGVNGYMFCAGTSTDDMGAFGRYHEWQAAVDSKGAARPHFAEMERFGRWVKTAGRNLAGWKKSPDVALGIYLPYFSTEYWKGEWVERLAFRRDHYWFDGLARLLALNNYNFSFVDICRSLDISTLVAAHLSRSLWVFTTECMDAETQRRLVGFVSAGGRLFIGPWMPAFDLTGKPCSILSEALGVKRVEVLEEKRVRINGGEGWFDGNLVCAHSPGSATLLKSAAGRPVAWIRKASRGARGAALFCGIPLHHTFDPAIPMVRRLAEALAGEPRVRAQSDADLPLVWRGTDREGLLLVPNYHDRPVRARLRINSPAFHTDWLTLPPRKAYFFPVNFPLDNGLTVTATGELLDVNPAPGGCTLVFDFPAGRNLLAVGRNRRRLDFVYGVQDRQRCDVKIRIRAGTDQPPLPRRGRGSG
ncbi:MAG: hypothetical protein A3G34_11860 [Candidatus Lindowbacteria bacterium RIFCSPLOWO2_12_FULL_62_27]|nr:MAG: hypothetical protein A3G34_11860 [Candidatus Lindowbacteria bacterium RIFCSPLOWO2_12_FULL_62_27]